MSLKSLLVLAALAVSSQARLPDGIIHNGPLTKRAGGTGCNADNALRNLRDSRYSSSASIFCSVWLQSTLTDTLSVTATSSATSTETPEPVTVTISATDTITNTETVYTTEYPTAVNTFAKRGEIGYPTWLAATYPATRVSSACSCFIASPSPPVVTTFTTTVATVTNTATTTLDALTNTETSFITVTASATKVITETGPEIPCGATGCSNGSGFLDATAATQIGQCQAFCLSHASCKSFQFSATFGHCNIFEVEVKDAYATGFSTNPVCSLFKFYDIRCVV
ncbi:uncharacterized protein DFL_003078 [Arthrobotrys flagrans]|uniref:Apple domain-containing protein n=1 Tax=Arthrobotrys flagrans TaxID=97331 RepID=A0A437ACB8_ARTFL|nr:hypothetical protein DFL_003078 [Arthrobotrys flagrans]